jgi:DNA-binding LytR/AlgR family response regulator
VRNFISTFSFPLAMKFLPAFFSVLNHPYPCSETRASHAWRMSAMIGLFVSLFLFVFQPWGLWLWQPDYKPLRILGFGTVTMCAMMLSFWLRQMAQRFLREDNWTVLHEILSVMFTLSLIAIGNFLYLNAIHLADFSIQSFTSAIIITLGVGVFPVAATTYRKYQTYLARNAEQASLVNAHLETKTEPETQANTPSEIRITKNTEPTHSVSDYHDASPIALPLTEVLASPVITLIAENEKDTVSLPIDTLLFIESADNYSTVFYLETEAVKQVMLRSSLSRLETQLTAQLSSLVPTANFLQRCHRSYIVNLQKVKSVSGNAQGYKLAFEHAATSVPVSRKYAATVLKLLAKS